MACYCKHCGTDVTTAKFCPNCGAPVDETTAQNTTPVYTNTETYANTGTDYSGAVKTAATIGGVALGVGLLGSLLGAGRRRRHMVPPPPPRPMGGFGGPRGGRRGGPGGGRMGGPGGPGRR